MEKLTATLTFLVLGFTCLTTNGSMNQGKPSDAEMILSKLARNDPMESTFAESRSNPFHRVNRLFEGTIYWDKDLGLAINYESPSAVLINITSSGIYLTRDSVTSLLTQNEDQADLLYLMLTLFSGDSEKVLQRFSVSTETNKENQWKLALVPQTKEMRNRFSDITLSGEAGLINSINIQIVGGRVIEIRILETTLKKSEFSCEEITTLFPYLNNNE